MTTFTPESIVNAIKDRHVKMTPRWQFLIKVVAIVLALTIVISGLFYFVSLIEYFWGQAHYDVLPGFGSPGYAILLRRFPWWHVVVVLVAFVLLFFLVRRFTSGYRVPLVTLLVGLFLMLVAGSLAVLRTPFHDELRARAETHGLPIFGQLYRGMDSRLSGNITVGTISAITSKGFVITTFDERAEITVRVTDDTQVPPDWVATEGERIIVLSSSEGSTIKARAIRLLADMPRYRRMPQPLFYRHMDIQ